MTQMVLDDLLCDAAQSQLVVIDIQGRLAAAMAEDTRADVFRNTGILLQAAERLGIPQIATEQYPKGLGHTDPAVAEHFGESLKRVEKTCFACSGEAGFRELLQANQRRQVVLCGMEAHICVLQSAMALRATGYNVFVVEDAVCSRSHDNRRNALERMRAAGVKVTNTESVLFEWLRDAGHEHFRALSALIK